MANYIPPAIGAIIYCQNYHFCLKIWSFTNSFCRCRTYRLSYSKHVTVSRACIPMTVFGAKTSLKQIDYFLQNYATWKSREVFLILKISRGELLGTHCSCSGTSVSRFKLSLTYTWVCFFFQLNLLPPYSLSSQGSNKRKEKTEKRE